MLLEREFMDYQESQVFFFGFACICFFFPPLWKPLTYILFNLKYLGPVSQIGLNFKAGLYLLDTSASFFIFYFLYYVVFY